MANTTRHLIRITGTTTAVDVATLFPIDTMTGRASPMEINRVKVKRASGAASANFTPKIYSTSGSAAGDITQEYVGANTGSAVLFDALNIGATCQSDDKGFLYLQINPNVGNTDTWSYMIECWRWS